MNIVIPTLEAFEDTVLIGERPQRIWRVWCKHCSDWHLHGPERDRHLCFPPAYVPSCPYRSGYHLRLVGKWTCSLNTRVAAICPPLDADATDGPDDAEQGQLHVGLVPASSEEHRDERHDYGPTTQ